MNVKWRYALLAGEMLVILGAVWYYGSVYVIISRPPGKYGPPSDQCEQLIDVICTSLPMAVFLALMHGFRKYVIEKIRNAEKTTVTPQPVPPA